MRISKVIGPALILLIGLSTTLVATTRAQSGDRKVLTNKDVLELLKSGLPAEIVAAKIKSTHCNFATELPDLKALKDGGVPDNVVLAMVQAPPLRHCALRWKDSGFRH